MNMAGEVVISAVASEPSVGWPAVDQTFSTARDSLKGSLP
jgi:hypothetical protein